MQLHINLYFKLSQSKLQLTTILIQHVQRLVTCDYRPLPDNWSASGRRTCLNGACGDHSVNHRVVMAPNSHVLSRYTPLF